MSVLSGDFGKGDSNRNVTEMRDRLAALLASGALADEGPDAARAPQPAPGGAASEAGAPRAPATTDLPPGAFRRGRSVPQPVQSALMERSETAPT